MSFNSDPEINELFQRYAQGDPLAFARLYEMVSPKVWGFLVKRVSSRAWAEEIFQEAWAKIHRTRESYDPAFPALPWIFMLTRSVWTDALRRQGHRHEIPVEAHELERVADQESFLTQAEVADSKTWVEIAPALSTGDRTLLEERYLKEWSFEEIGKRLNLSEAGVRQRISRIFKKIRSQRI